MTRPRLRSCFISAPFGADTSLLRKVLDEKRIQWHDQTDVRVGDNWITAVEAAITRTDFVCLVLPAQSYRENALFELGMAYARRKPVLAFLGPSVSLPSDLLGLTYVRMDTSSDELVRSAVDAFLAHAIRPAPAALSRKTGTRSHPQGPSPTAASSNAGFAAEQRTAALLTQAGFIVSDVSTARDSRADLAVWIDEVQHSLGNPLLVEVKAGRISERRLADAAVGLRQHVVTTHGRCGLIVYWDDQERDFAEISPGWPLIFCLSGQTLSRLLSSGELATRLVALRNRAAHGTP